MNRTPALYQDLNINLRPLSVFIVVMQNKKKIMMRMMYELGLQVVGISGTHISFIAKPQCNTSEEESCECPILFIDSSPNLAGDDMDQAIYAWNNQDDLVVDDQESFMLGLFPLKAILNSFQVGYD